MGKLKNQKAFTIIELIVVIAIIGILVLLAALKFSDYTEKVKVANIKNDILAYERTIEGKRSDGDKHIEGWEKVSPEKMESLKSSMFNKKGLMTSSNKEEFKDEIYYSIPKDRKLVKSYLNGNFYLGQGGKVYYHDEKLADKIKDNPSPMHTVTFNDYYGETIEEKTVEKGGSVKPPKLEVKGYSLRGWNKELTNINEDLIVEPVYTGPSDVDLGMENDFKWIESSIGYDGSNGEKGYFLYIGEGKDTVEIPHAIKGIHMTSYYGMFKNSKPEIKKIISTNKNIKDFVDMFYFSDIDTLDLTQLHTSSVENMKSMFSYSNINEVDLSSFDTSKVTNMDYMFHSSEIKVLDLNHFDTSKVVSMNNMFRNISADVVKVQNFNTSNVAHMRSMFESAKTENLDLSGLDTENVKDMERMFYQAKASILDVSSFDTSNVSNMNSMFRATLANSIVFSDKFTTHNVKDMSSMFSYAKAKELDLSSFDMINVLDTNSMFYQATAEKGYSRTQKDADILNAELLNFNSSSFTFKVKIY